MRLRGTAVVVPSTKAWGGLARVCDVYLVTAQRLDWLVCRLSCLPRLRWLCRHQGPGRWPRWMWALGYGRSAAGGPVAGSVGPGAWPPRPLRERRRRVPSIPHLLTANGLNKGEHEQTADICAVEVDEQERRILSLFRRSSVSLISAESPKGGSRWWWPRFERPVGG